MKVLECLREREVFEAVSTERWPEYCSEELRKHVQECQVCTDVLHVAQVIQADYSEAPVEGRLPSAGLVWWRAELRARREAMRKVERPLTFVHAFGAACVTGALFALLAQAWPWLRSWFQVPVLSGFSLPSINTSILGSISLTQWGWPLAVVAITAILGSVALYFVLSDE